MSNEPEDSERKSGCPPHEFGNALAWRWTREMPPVLKGGFLTLLYAMRAMAAVSGELRFTGDGRPIRIQDIARAAGCREKDCRRYLDAAIAAGVVAARGQRRRGTPTLYALVLCPWPAWQAAADHIKATARARKSEETERSSGHSGPNSSEEGSGHSGPNSDEEVRATAARTGPEEVRATAAPTGSGHSGPTGSGHSGPNNPGSTHEDTQERAEVVPQPQESSSAADTDDYPPIPNEARRCPCGKGRILRADRDHCGGCLREQDQAAAEARKAREKAAPPVQGAFLLPLAGGGQGSPHKRREPVPWPTEDPTAPLRTCECGRTYRLADQDRCPVCVVAAEEARRDLDAVSNG
ncbi:hypothetical protein [Streptomyces sp. NPDC053560]|uniref:hypothetical protein n=1 Tax=Streptomyces sp. NPDC053560 TaxID=3365711 RepID=UPI0037D5D59B